MNSIEKYSQGINNYLDSVDLIISKAKEMRSTDDIKDLEKLKEVFNHKIDDFFREDRKLNIGVIGQVKAGKSSFLNRLLFDGKNLLPKASTPKTATLTKIEYGEENKMEIEYYSLSEWNGLMKNLKDSSETSSKSKESILSKELFDIYNTVNFSLVKPKLEVERESFVFENYEELFDRLNNYVGEDGEYTQIVKAVIIYINKKELQGISIVDTPGLSDPILSRTIRTKEFMEVCDVVFLVSQSTEFLNASDWELLSTQLPNKGVKRIALIGSKFDSAIRGVLRKIELDFDNPFDAAPANNNFAKNIEEAIERIEVECKKQAEKKIDFFIEDIKNRNKDESWIELMRSCKTPILISSIAHTMSEKDYENYDEEEKNIYNGLKDFFENPKEDLKKIGNFSKAKDIYNKAVEEKEQVLSEKINSFIPQAEEQLKKCIEDIYTKRNNSLEILKSRDKKDVMNEKNNASLRINSIKADVRGVFGESLAKLQTEKSETISDLKKQSSEFINLKSHTGTRTTYSTHTSYKHQFLCFKWGKETTTQAHNEYYSYLDASDALSNIHAFSNELESNLTKIFSKSASISDLKKLLLTVVVNNFEMGVSDYDPSFYKILTEQALNQISFPILSFDFKAEEEKIASRFSGEITSSSEMAQLRSLLSEAIKSICDIAVRKVESEIDSFKKELEKSMTQVSEKLLENIEDEFTKICDKFENKEKEIKLLQSYVLYLRELKEGL